MKCKQNGLNFLFPAHAGVIPKFPPIKLRRESVPRTRGGDPMWMVAMGNPRDCSPHTRG